MNYSFMVWWRKTDGKTYAESYEHPDLGTAQGEWARWKREMVGWPDDVVVCGLTQIRWPAGRSGPRDGEAGDEPALVRSPEAGSAEVAA